MKKIKEILALVLVFALCAGTAAFGADAGPIKIGFIGPLTGPVAAYGVSVRNGTELYTNIFNDAGGINGRKIELIIYDDRHDPTEALSAYNRLVTADEITAFMGPVTSGPTFGVAEASAEDNIPGITPTATHPDVTKYGNHFFRACFLDPFQGACMARFAREYMNAGTAAVIYDVTGAYSTGLYDAFAATAAEIGLNVVTAESYAADDVDFNAQLAIIANLAPDVIFMPDYYNKAYLIASQARQFGITSTFLGVDGTDGVLEIEGADTSVFEGMFLANHYFSGDPSEFVQSFRKDYEAAYGIKPNAFAALGFDVALILYDAIAKVAADGVKIGPTSESRQAIIDKMAATDLEGVTGRITFDKDNNAVKEVPVIKIQDNAYIFETRYK